MNPRILEKLEQINEQYKGLSEQLADPDILNDQENYLVISKKHHQLQALVDAYGQWQAYQTQLSGLEVLIAEDAEMRDMALAEKETISEQVSQLTKKCMLLLIPKDPDDNKSVFLEIRAGAGGAEAAIFVGNCMRMYHMFAEQSGWQVEVVSQRPSGQGGFRECVLSIKGEHVFRDLKYESGTHRVQRVPDTESQGRIHTSTITVAVLPHVEAVDHVNIDQGDLKIDTFRASGAGGQHVNTTDSAVRITHIPSGVVVECQDERSQHKNKAKALSVLGARVLAMEREKQMRVEKSLRRSLVGRGDRSERIRTYNFPQSRVTDHRINLTLYQLDAVMLGQLSTVIAALQQEDEANRLAGLLDENF